jgi:hypothetical protein
LKALSKVTENFPADEIIDSGREKKQIKDRRVGSLEDDVGKNK